MSDKHLTEKEWKAFCKEGKSAGYKGEPLAKALAAFESAQKSHPAEALKALDELDKHAQALLKAHKGDKALAAWLDDMDRAAAKARKDTEKALKDAEAEEEEDDDEPASALLDPKKLFYQLNLCKRDPERRVQFGYVDAADKQSQAVLALSPKLSGRKLYSKLQTETGVKTGSYGTAWVEGTELMLRPGKPLGGLAKKMKPAVRASGFRITKVVLWSEDGSVLEQEEEGGAEEGEEPGGEANDAADGQTPADPSQPDPQRAAYQRRAAELAGYIKAALLAKLPGAAEIERLTRQAMEAGTRQDWAAGLALYEQLHQLLQPPVSDGADPGAGQHTPGANQAAEKAAVNASIKAYLETLPGDIRALAAKSPEAAARLGAQLKAAVALAQGGGLPQALAALNALADALAEATRGARNAEAGEAIPQGLVAERVHTLELAAAGWQVERLRSIEGLGELVATLMTEEDPELLEIATRVATLATGIPEALDARMAALRRAVQGGDTAGIAPAKAAVLAELRGAAAFLKNEATPLRNCEDNPFGITVRIVAPLAEAIRDIQAALAHV